MGRAVIAVVAGFSLWTVLWLAANAGLAAALPESFRADGSTDSAGILLTLLGLSVVFSIASGYTCATLVRDDPSRPVLALAALLLLVGIGVQVGYWEVMPLWYHLAFLALLMPAVLVGRRLRLETAPGVQTG